MNCNVTIDTQDLAVGQIVASAIRESSPGGIPGVQVMALPHEGAVEIACNVESVQGGPPSSSYGEEKWPSFTIGGQNFCHAPASLVTVRVAELARHHGVASRVRPWWALPTWVPETGRRSTLKWHWRVLERAAACAHVNKPKAFTSVLNCRLING